MYKIEKIALPKSRGYISKLSKTCLELEVGQSFLVPEKDIPSQVASRVSYLGKRHNKKFGVRKQEDGSYRIGRTK